jgi:hypothetical protein
MPPPPDIQKFRDRCEQIFSQMCQQTMPGYLGKVEIDCRMPTSVYTIQIHEFPISCFKVSSEEAKQWQPNNISYLKGTQVPVGRRVDFTEEIIFRIYQTTGYGSVLIKFWYLDHLPGHKAEFQWLVSHKRIA